MLRAKEQELEVGSDGRAEAKGGPANDTSWAWPHAACQALGPEGYQPRPGLPLSSQSLVVLWAGLGLPVTEVPAGAACPGSLPLLPEAPDLSKCQYLMRSSFESLKVPGSKETC